MPCVLHIYRLAISGLNWLNPNCIRVSSPTFFLKKTLRTMDSHSSSPPLNILLTPRPTTHPITSLHLIHFYLVHSLILPPIYPTFFLFIPHLIHSNSSLISFLLLFPPIPFSIPFFFIFFSFFHSSPPIIARRKNLEKMAEKSTS